jgi:hypothetical protein
MDSETLKIIECVLRCSAGDYSCPRNWERPKILGTIYSLYLDDFLNYSPENKTHEEKIYLPIEIKKIAEIFA